MNDSGKKYTAFISYRHMPLDINVAKKIHTKTERYKVPRALRMTGSPSGLGKVFRDEEELPASNDLSNEIKNALDNSEYLLVVCSPDTPGSIWVEREIAYFLSGHGRDKMIAILAEGTADESFPDILTTIRDSEGNEIGKDEPLAANLTGLDHHYSRSRLSREIVRIYAAILKVPFDVLWQRERRHRMHRNILIASLAALVLLAFSTTALISSYRINERNRLIEQQNTEIERKNDEITSRNEELEISRAESLVRESDLLYEKGDLHGAVAAALELAKTPTGKTDYSAETARLLGDALGAGQYYHYMNTAAVADLDYSVEDLILSKDNKYVFASDLGGNISCISSADGSVIWKTYSDNLYGIHVSDKCGIILVDEHYGIRAYDMYTGEPVWNREGRLVCISEDGGSLAVFDDPDKNPVCFVLDMKTGKPSLSIDINSFGSTLTIDWNKAAFSGDGRYIAAAVESPRSSYKAVLIDTSTKKTVLYDELLGDIQETAVVFSCLGESFFVIYYDMEKHALCLQEYYFDGKRGNYTECKKDLSMIQTLEWGVTPHVFRERDDTVTIVTILDTAFMFLGSHGELSREENLSSKDILGFGFLNEDDLQRVYMYDDGTIDVVLNDAITLGVRFSRKMHFEKFAVSDGILSNESSGSGYRLDPDAVEAAVCDDDRSMVYIMRPAMDPHVKDAKWSEGIVCYANFSGIIPADDTYVYINGEKDFVSNVFRKINVTTDKSEKEYVISDDFSEETGSVLDMNNVCMWKEQDKFGYFDRHTALIYDLEKGSYKHAFGDDDVRSSTCRNDKDGHMLAAAIISRMGEHSYDHLLYPCAVGEDEKPVLLSDGPVTGLSEDILSLSGDGSLLYAVEDETGKYVYHIADIDGAKEVRINAVCDNADPGGTGITPGDRSPVFAMAESDGKIRIYDAVKGAVSCELSAEYGTDGIAAMCFCDDDRILAVCTNDKYLRFYDVEKGELLHEEHFEGSDNFTNIRMQIWKDEENSRYCIRLSDGELFMMSTGDFKLISAYDHTNGYNPYTRQIYRKTNTKDDLGDSSISGAYIYYPAYTLDELIRWGEEFNS